MRGTVVSLCDRTGNMVRPWIENGYRAVTVDLQPKQEGDDRFHIVCDVLSLSDDFAKQFRPVAVFAFPPCTNLAVSGARWFTDKGLAGLIDGLRLVEKCRAICEASGAPWMLENPVSTLSTYWRKPDHTFHPWHYTAFELGDNYTKTTCLWTGGGFVMPAQAHDEALGQPDDRIHKAPPSDDRADIRSATPMGFARAVFQSNGMRQAA
jgi:hypothetical protein